ATSPDGTESRRATTNAPGLLEIFQSGAKPVRSFRRWCGGDSLFDMKWHARQCKCCRCRDIQGEARSILSCRLPRQISAGPRTRLMKYKLPWRLRDSNKK